VRPRTRTLRVTILLDEKSDRKMDHPLEPVQRLQGAGHVAGFAEKTMRGLGMDVKRIARFAGTMMVDAWVVVAGPRDVLEWFAEPPTPAFALFGRLTQVNLASTSPKKAGAPPDLADRLIDLGHRRIVILAREDRRKPDPGFLERLFLDHLEKREIPTGPYNLPDWGDPPAELRRILESLFQRTPPTALVIGEPSLFFAVMQHLASLGVTTPDQVSLACTDASHAFDWCLPDIPHITWDFRPLVQRVVKWANNISRGKDDRRKSSGKARLVVGGTIGPVPKGR
jgi:DNA-binding LacI/PurR family transcriptional regulator